MKTSLDMTPEAVVNRAMSFDISAIIKRYAADEELPLRVAEEHLNEVKRYLVLGVLNATKTYQMWGQLDKAWHTFIIFTSNYQNFGETVAGRMIHHIPASVGETDFQHASLDEFKADYAALYGNEPPCHLWPVFSPDANLAGCQASCTGCSSGGHPTTGGH